MKFTGFLLCFFARDPVCNGQSYIVFRNTIVMWNTDILVTILGFVVRRNQCEF